MKFKAQPRSVGWPVATGGAPAGGITLSGELAGGEFVGGGAGGVTGGTAGGIVGGETGGAGGEGADAVTAGGVPPPPDATLVGAVLLSSLLLPPQLTVKKIDVRQAANAAMALLDQFMFVFPGQGTLDAQIISMQRRN